MNVKQPDYVALAIIGGVLVLGLALTWQSYQQWLALGEMGGHMGDGAAAMHGTHPVWYLLGTVVAVALVGGGYLAMRDQFVGDEADATLGARVVEEVDSQPDGDAVAPTADAAGDEGAGDVVDTGNAAATDDQPSRPLLDVLPEDERRILQPVVDSPGLTQIELRDRSDFSKSKVSQTVSDLEKRGLLYREPQGRTYRVYPSDEIEEP